MKSENSYDDLIRYAIDTWGFIIGWHQQLTMAEFADLILKHTQHQRGQIVADALKRANGFVRRSFGRFQAQWIVA